MKFTEFLFTTKTYNEYFPYWDYRCACGKLFGEVKEKNDIKSNHPFYWIHLCGGMKVWLYHIFKPTFKFIVFFPFLILWSFWTATEVTTNFGFMIYSLFGSIPLYALYEHWFKNWRTV